jgi:hypothetical protein
MKVSGLLIALSFCIISMDSILAQDTEVPAIKLEYGLIAKTYKDSIVLRWAPMDPTALPAHIQAGVWIEKLTVSGKYPYKLTEWKRVSDQPILPAPIEAFNNEDSKSDEHQMLVAQLLYGNIPTSTSKSEIGVDPEQASMLHSLFSMTLLGCDYSREAAIKMGVRFTTLDKIKENEKIFFRIYSAFEHPLFEVDTAITFSTYGEWEADIAPKYLTATSKEKAVELSWPYNRELNRWAGFNIQRTSDGANFTKLNKKPYMTMTENNKGIVVYTDSVENYVKYQYRIEALDPFGESAGYSEIITGFGKDLTPPPGLILKEKSNDGQSIELKWEFENKQLCDDLSHFLVMKGKGINNIIDTIKLLTKSDRAFIYDFKALTTSTYFEIIAVDTAGNFTSSNPVRYFISDIVPPVPPAGIEAKMNKDGIVSLLWNQVPDDELIGYRVYRTNNPAHEMVCLMEGYLQDTIFSDTLELHTLSEEVYYAISAIDLSYNHSNKSALIKLAKPDIVPPIPPQIIHYEVYEKSVSIKWTSSPSEDLAAYILERKTIDKDEIISTSLDRTIHEYSDSTIKASTQYEYKLFAKDDADLMSEASFPLTVRTYFVEPFDSLQLSWLNPELKNGFSWNAPTQKPGFYIVYKDEGSGFTQYANVDGQELKFLDLKATEINGKAIKYGLQSVKVSGSKSPIFYIQ